MEFRFGVNIISFKKGNKHADDYLIFHNNEQIPDLKLFQWLLQNAHSEKEAKLFILAFIDAKQIQLNADAVVTEPSPLDKEDVYQYCTSQNQLSEILRELLFVSLLRCDIDNICYPPPKLNGCIRLLAQIIALFALKYGWKEYTLVPHQSLKEDNYAQLIFDIGFPKNAYQIGKEGFKKLYAKFKDGLK